MNQHHQSQGKPHGLRIINTGDLPAVIAEMSRMGVTSFSIRQEGFTAAITVIPPDQAAQVPAAAGPAPRAKALSTTPCADHRKLLREWFDAWRGFGDAPTEVRQLTDLAMRTQTAIAE